MAIGQQRSVIGTTLARGSGASRLAIGCVAALICAPPAVAQCMTRGVVDANGKTRSFTILAPATEARDYAALGFTATPCVLTAAQLTSLAGSLCKLKAAGNTAVQNRLEHVLGARPVKICGSANNVLKAAGLSIATDTATADAVLGLRR